MGLCEACQGVNFLLPHAACISQCLRRQRVQEQGEDERELDDFPDERFKAKPQPHHLDITELKECQSAQDCGLCKVILDAFDQHSYRNREAAKSCPILICEDGIRIKVCYRSKDRNSMIKICGLDVYVDAAKVDWYRDYCKGIKGHAYTEGIKEHEYTPVLRTMDKYPRSKEQIALASRWLETCRNDHGDKCHWPGGEVPRHPPPKRLIDVSDDVRCPFLIETSSRPGNPFRWLSLSYCWGEDPPAIKLTRELMDSMKAGIPLCDLDPTIRDAILVTRDLGIPYIWVDSLCIVQDGEWNQEASRMNDIYGGSEATLVVANTNSVKESFLKERELPNYIHILSSKSHNFHIYLSPECKRPDDLAEDSQWHGRGWTMQEGLLPHRILYYTSSQIFWRCHEGLRSERGVTTRTNDIISKSVQYTDAQIWDFGSGWPPDLARFHQFKLIGSYIPFASLRAESSNYRFHLSHPDSFHPWLDIIKEYTSRRFTKEHDRMVALSGVAKIYAEAIACRGDEYLAGLWKPDIIRELSWYTRGSPPTADTKGTPQSSLAIFPSWSWASAGCKPVLFRCHRTYKAHEQARVIEADIRLVDKNEPFGSVKEGSSITLKGGVKHVPRLRDQGGKYLFPISEVEHHLSKVSRLDDTSNKNSPPQRGDFAVLQMISTFEGRVNLILETTGDVSKDGVPIYRRVGILDIRLPNVEDVASPEFLKKFEHLFTEEESSGSEERTLEYVPDYLWINGNSDVYREFIDGAWSEESVTII
ncbi:HET domain containing protein [Rhypophila decipiens]